MNQPSPISFPDLGGEVPYPGPRDLDAIIRMWGDMSRDARRIVYTTTMAIAAREGLIGPSHSLLPKGGN